MGCGSSKNSQPRQSGYAQRKGQSSGLYVPPPDFPSPGILARCQQEFAQLDTSELMYIDDDGLPAPFPPKNLKSDIFVPLLYADLRKYFKPTEEHLLLLLGPMQNVISHINQFGNDDVGQLYSMFTWLIWAAYSLSDLEFTNEQYRPTQDSVLYRIILARQSYGTYNDIFFDMCKLAGWKVKVVPGIVKHVCKDHVVITRNSSWLAVMLRGFWRLIDVDFAVSVSSKQEDDEEDASRILVSPRRPKAVSLTDQAMADFYFLTDPEKFIFSHLPDDDRWQLLAKTVSNDEFEDMANVTESFFLAGFEDLEEPRNTLLHEKKNPLKLKLMMKADNRVRVEFDFVRIKGKPTAPTIDGKKYHDFCTLENDEGMKTIDIRVPDIGLFCLTMTCCDVREIVPMHRLIGRWFVTSEYPDLFVDVNPPNPRHEFGIGAEMHTVGISIKELDIVDGIAHVQFESNEKFIEAMHTIESTEVRPLKLKPFYRYYNMNRFFGVIMKFPQSGKFILKTFVKERGSVREFHNICSYLLQNRVPCPDSTPFPPGFKNRMGYLMENEKPKLTPTSHPVPFFKVTDGEPLGIKLKSKYLFQLDNKMKVQTQTGVTDLSEYVWWGLQAGDEVEQNKYFLEVRLPKAGMYCLDIRCRTNDAEKFQDYFRYVFIVASPCIPCSPFPRKYPGWLPNYTIDGYMNGYVIENRKIEFAFTVPEATDVNIYREDAVRFSCLFSEGRNQVRQEVAVGKAGQALIVGAKFTATKTLTYLLQYRIISDKDWNDLQKLNMQEADTLQDIIKSKMDELRLQAKEEENQKNALVQQRMQDYEAEKNDLILQTQTEFENYQAYREERLQQMMVNQWGSLPDEEHDRLLKAEIDKIIDEQNQELQKLRKIYQDMTKTFETQQLVVATRTGHQSALRRYVDQYQARPASRQHEQSVKAAQRQLEILNIRNSLVTATKGRDVDEMIRLIDEVTTKGYLKALQYETSEAQKLVDALQHAESLKYYVMNIDKRIMSELRSYQKPPQAVHKVMQAVLLLLGVDEQATAEWSACARLAIPQGPKGLSRRIAAFDISAVHPEIRARARVILHSLEFKSFQRSSAGASTFYIWALGTIEDYESTLPEDSEETDMPAANIPRQKEIFAELKEQKQTAVDYR